MLFISNNLISVHQREEEKHLLSKLINEKRFTKIDTSLSYRQINTLSKDKLFPEDRSNHKGWRKFSLKELIFFSIISELKKFGLSHIALKQLSDSFFKELIDENKPELGKYMSETAIGCVLIQSEIMLTITSSGEIGYYDPTFYLLFGREKTPSIQIRLNDIINNIRIKLKEKPFPIKLSARGFYLNKLTLGLTTKQEEILKIISNKNFSGIYLRKTNGEVSLIKAERIIETKSPTIQKVIQEIEAKGYQEITVIKNDGEIVCLKAEETIRI
jgi:hypothetical protein